MEKIGVFGGAFNPPHNFHFSVAQEILNNDKDFSKIIFVPVGDKYKKDGLISAEHRFNMLKGVCDNNKKFEVSRIEIDETEQLKAFQTLDKLSKVYSTAKLYFIIGTDSLKTLDTWANLDYLLYKIGMFDSNNLIRPVYQQELLSYLCYKYHVNVSTFYSYYLYHC